MDTWWESAGTDGLAQGELIPNCPVPILPPGADLSNGANLSLDIEWYDVIVLTQTCDILWKKPKTVVVCAVFNWGDYTTQNQSFSDMGQRELVRQGRVEGVHLLDSPVHPNDNSKALVVNFRDVHVIPHAFLDRHAKEGTVRVRLKSPYLEHLSQGFGRYFMRVGLPSTIPEYKKVKATMVPPGGIQ